MTRVSESVSGKTPVKLSVRKSRFTEWRNRVLGPKTRPFIASWTAISPNSAMPTSWLLNRTSTVNDLILWTLKRASCLDLWPVFNRALIRYPFIAPNIARRVSGRLTAVCRWSSSKASESVRNDEKRTRVESNAAHFHRETKSLLSDLARTSLNLSSIIQRCRMLGCLRVLSDEARLAGQRKPSRHAAHFVAHAIQCGFVGAVR